MDPYVKITKKFTKMYGSKVINRKTGLQTAATKSRDEKAFWEAEKWWTTMLVVLLLLLLNVVQAVLPHLHCVKSCHLHLVLLACCAKSPPPHGIPRQHDKSRFTITLKYSSDKIIPFSCKCSILLSLILCLKNKGVVKNVKHSINLWCLVPGTICM